MRGAEGYVPGILFGKDDNGKPKAEDIKAVLSKALEVMPGIKATVEPISKLLS